MPPSQGFTYLCGCFAAVISITKAVNNIKKLNRKYQREMLDALYTYLDDRNELLNVMKEGSSRPQVRAYLYCLKQKLKADFNIDVSITLPLLKQKKIKQSEILEFIEKHAKIPKSSILFGLTGVHSHWTTADTVKNQNILLLDSSYLKRLPLRNFPAKHQISKNDVFLIKVIPQKCCQNKV